MVQPRPLTRRIPWTAGRFARPEASLLRRFVPSSRAESLMVNNQEVIDV